MPQVPRALTGGGRKSTQDLASLPVVLQEGRSTYVWGLDLISATDKDGNQTYFLYDGLGSTTGLADDEGNVTAGYGYDVFGATRSQSGTADTMFRFTGEQRDSDSGLYYLRARYYDPATGRLVTKDPIPGGNPYAYAGNDPVRYVDPGGLCIPGYNCPPGQGGGIFPPFLPISKEGRNFDQCSLEYARALERAGVHPQKIYEIIRGIDSIAGTYDEDRDCLLRAIAETSDPLLDAVKWLSEHPECSGTSVVALFYWWSAVETYGATSPQAVEWSVAVGLGCASAATGD